MERCFGNLTYADENQKQPQPIIISKRKFVIGRGQGCDLTLNNRMVSGHHCYIETLESGQVYLHDTSSNGTLLNKTILTHGQKHQINTGDEFRVVFKKGLKSLGLIFRAPTTGSNQEEREGDGASSLNDTEEYTLELPAHTTDGPVIRIPGDKDASECDLPTTQVEKQIKVDLPTAQVEKQTKAEATKSGDDEIEDHLICSICQDIMYKPVSLQPCMHCFCSGCYSEWMAISQECPQCRVAVDRIGPNHIVSNLVNAYLKLHPEKQRDEEDVKELDAKNVITHDMLYSGKLLHVHSSDLDDSYESSSDEDNFTVFVGRQKRPFAPHHKICRQCPDQPDVPCAKRQVKGKDDDIPRVGTAGCSQPSTSAGPATPNFTCKKTTQHIHCSCCFEYMPNRTLDRQRDLCPIPTSYYCSMYWGCKAPACTACLAPLRSIIFAENCLDHIINRNTYESDVLKGYLESRKMGWREVFTQCLAKLDSGAYTISMRDFHELPSYQHARPVVITSQTTVCKFCAYKCFTYLAYQYRADISREDLNDEVTRREDCYWGQKCRSQTKYHHAKNFNHICQQTRFK